MTVYLPLACEKGESPSTTALAVDEADEHLESLRVLVVDDELDERELLATVLSGYGAEVTAASDVSQALDLFHSCAPHVVVSDLEMPGDDGFALIRRLRACATDVPAIAVSGLASQADAARAHGAGFDAHLAKPIEPRALARCVRELSAKRRS